jgi:hypothetical protein
MYLGPYSVMQQKGNDVECRHLASGAIVAKHVSRLKVFHGSQEDAKKLACLDYEQHEVEAVTAHCGDPLKRSTMEFEILFRDGEIQWLKFSPDIFATVPYELYCRSRSYLLPLLVSVEQAAVQLKTIKGKPISSVAPGDTVYVDLREDPAWYYGLDDTLPDVFHSVYVWVVQYVEWVREPKKIRTYTPVLDEYRDVENYWVFAYGSVLSVPTGATVVDEAFVLQYPAILPAATRSQILKRARHALARR